MNNVHCFLDNWHDLRDEVLRKLQRIQLNCILSELEEKFLSVYLFYAFSEMMLPFSCVLFKLILYEQQQICNIRKMLILLHLLMFSEDRKEVVEVLLAKEAIPLKGRVENVFLSFDVSLDAS